MPSTRAKRATKAAPKAKAQRWVYLFAGGKAEGNAKMRALLGGKGAGLAEMTNAGLPVPPGFTITTAACNAYFKGGRKLPPGLWDQVEHGLATVERKVPEAEIIVRSDLLGEEVALPLVPEWCNLHEHRSVVD